MDEEMGKLDRVIRCMTSRRICFPLIFMIATISLAVTSIQLSYVKPSRIYLQWKPQSQRQSRNLREEMVVNVQLPQRFVEKPRSVKDGDEFMIEDAFPKVEVPYLKHNFKSKVKESSRPTLKKLALSRRQRAAIPEESSQIEAEGSIKKAQIMTKNDSNNLNSDVKHKTLDGRNAKIGSLPEHDRIEQHNIHSTSEKPSSEQPPMPAKGVVILTNYRSGSTFLGQLFNQHPEAFYTFEPLYPFGANCSFQISKRAETLRNMLKCHFPSMQELYNDIGVDPRSNRVHASCLRNNFCFRYNHEHLCTEEVCPLGDRYTCQKCGPVDLPLVNNKCRSRKVSVIKVIKLCHVKSIEYLFHDANLDLKIIHLVRDPRGIASSRLKIHPDWDIAESIYSACQRQAANVRAGRQAAWLKGRYKLVRYEDLASNPMELAGEIYDFVGLPFADSVKNWITTNTRSNTNATTDRNYVAKQDPYSTQRDSTTAMQAWRKHLSFDTVSKIQKRCFEALRSLGYKDFKTKRDLLNLDLSAVL